MKKLIPAAYQLSLHFFRAAKFQPAPPPPVPCADPVLRAIWEKLRHEYFPELEELEDYAVVWSRRKHRNTLASCNVERKRVVVAPVMKEFPATVYLEALIYHEMCHAALGRPKVVRGRRCLHGREFKALERRHPAIPALDEWVKNGGWHAAVRKYNRSVSSSLSARGRAASVAVAAYTSRRSRVFRQR